MELTSTTPIIANYSNETNNKYETEYEKHFTLFWSMVVFYLFLAVIAIDGNALVIYASHGKRNHSRLRHLDGTIKSLAVADLLYGMLGAPFLILAYYMGQLHLRLHT